MMTVSIM